MAEVLKVVNVKFQSEKEMELHAKFKAVCAIEGISMQEKMHQLIRSCI